MNDIYQKWHRLGARTNKKTNTNPYLTQIRCILAISSSETLVVTVSVTKEGANVVVVALVIVIVDASDSGACTPPCSSSSSMLNSMGATGGDHHSKRLFAI